MFYQRVIIKNPMLRTLLLVSTGVVIAQHFSLPLPLLLAAAAIVVLSLIIRPTAVAFGAALVLFGATNMELRGEEVMHTPRLDHLATTMHHWGEERIARLGLKKQSREVVTALTISTTEAIEGDTRRNYSMSGMAHLLAISGLHVGFIFMIIFTIATPLVMLRGGNELRSVVALLLLWLYTLLAALSPSVVRAALMLTLYEAGRCLSLRTSSIDTIAAVVLIMVVISPAVLFSLSLQLSVIAVAAIVLWGLPLLPLIFSRLGVVNALIANVVISLCCTIATLPLVSHHFGYISIVGVVVSPAAMLLSVAIMSLTFIWFLLPDFAIIGEAIGWITELQNSLAEWGAAQSWGVVERTIATPLVIVTYTLFAIFTIYLSRDSSKSK